MYLVLIIVYMFPMATHCPGIFNIEYLDLCHYHSKSVTSQLQQKYNYTRQGKKI